MAAPIPAIRIRICRRLEKIIDSASRDQHCELALEMRSPLLSYVQTSRTVRNSIWGVLALWALGLAFLRIRSEPSLSTRVRQGERVTVERTARTLGGDTLPLLPSDSSVAILITSAECDKGRIGIPTFREVDSGLRQAGIAFRVVVKSRPPAARQYARLFPHPDLVINDASGAVLKRLNTTVVPSLVLIRADGTVLGSWSPVPVGEAGSASLMIQIRRAALLPPTADFPQS